ncbi:MAG: mechanosensitive ion channel family protein [Rhodothermales bacterium]|nr:mechanosensitive ion channel family protein [Rhodothermales bacterium]
MQQIASIATQFSALLDLSSVPEGVREGIGEQTSAFLLDIFGRIDLPSPADVPDLESMAEESAPTSWRIPGTPIRIARIAEGPREGEFLFSGETIRAAPRMFEAIQRVPLRSSLGIGTWSVAVREWTGPIIPAGVSSAIPNILRGFWWDTPIWKVLATIAMFILSALVIAFMHHALNRRESKSRIGFLLRRALTPLSILVAVPFIEHIVDLEINVTGAFGVYADTARTVIAYSAWGWLLWLILMIIVERIILFRKRPEGDFDEQLLRIFAGALGVVGGVIIVGAGAQKVGLPLYSVVAGLGIGGLAVALAVRPTLENMIGGVMLYLDRPVQVGEFCSFGDKTGTIESIGVRTTKIRGADRTLISVPNAVLADMQLINWARCDWMLINQTIGLRFETTPDQIRILLVKVREMIHTHPKIDRDTVRVRYTGPAAASRDVDIRIYALTHDWNEYYAIREDIFLRIDDLVEAAGILYAVRRWR